MSAELRLLGLVVEGPSDARIVPSIVDQILTEQAGLLEDRCENVRAFVGLVARSQYLAWRDVNSEAKARVPRMHGPFSGVSAVEDARTARYALQCFVVQEPRPAAVVLVRDSDGKPEERLKGLEQARGDREWPFPVVIGVAHSMIECWVLSAFIPQVRREISALATVQKELGFDPTARSDRLTALNKVVRKRPKQILSRLTNDDEAREGQCWPDAGIDRVRERGTRNGLADFVCDVEQRIVPLFTMP